MPTSRSRETKAGMIISTSYSYFHVRRDYNELHVQIPGLTTSHDDICVIVNRLTKSTYLVVVRQTYFIAELAKLCIDHIVRLLGVHVTIISDQDTRFTSKF